MGLLCGGVCMCDGEECGEGDCDGEDSGLLSFAFPFPALVRQEPTEA